MSDMGSAMRAKFGQNGAGFDGISKPYDHEARMPKLASEIKVRVSSIEEIKVPSKRDVEDTDDSEKDGPTLDEIVASLGQRSSSRGAKQEEPRVEVAEASESQKLIFNMALKQWFAAGEKLTEDRSKQYGLIWGNMSAEDRDNTMKEKRFQAVRDADDGLLLWQLVVSVKSVASVKHVYIAKSKAENNYYGQKMGNVSLITYYTRFKECIKALKAAGVRVPDDEDVARHFIDRLDSTRWGEHIVRLHNEIADGNLGMPENLEAAYNWADGKVVAAKSRSGADSSSGLEFTSLVGKAVTSFYDRTCNYCQKKGHLAKDCRSRQKNMKQSDKKSAEKVESKADKAEETKANGDGTSQKKKKKGKQKQNDPEEDGQGTAMTMYERPGVTWAILQYNSLMMRTAAVTMTLGNSAILLDTGSEIHLTPCERHTTGLRNVHPAVPPYAVRGIGKGVVYLNKIGNYLDIGPMYVGRSPCTILSLGLAAEHGARFRWATDASWCEMKTPAGKTMMFKRVYRLYIYSPDNESAGDDFDDDRGARTLLTEAEARAKFSERDLKEADQAGEYLKR